MKTNFKTDSYDALDILEAIDAPYEEKFYENDCITDYKKKPYQLVLFLRVFGLKKYGKEGKLTFYSRKDIIEFNGNTHKQIADKLNKEVDSCEGSVPDNVPQDWMPDKWIKIKKAIKVFNLSVKK